ncbi:methyl-accepting chemotaxis protein [Roseimaritima ulvae]|uniref:Frizzy aggregation protein FrzCD n=1 Tax=Roseimaritima ulvae TaxID=980254 RepID=A0A5B9QZ09_9BACT|nr:methyl-accepting chemotaxis protein [Roseimaritima ulvae]QEG39213.1 Frizzy aggregation protein FrzCD [Roseimaritima ulvae]
MLNRGVLLKLVVLVVVSIAAFCALGMFGVRTNRQTFQSVREVRETAVEFRNVAQQITEPLNQLRELSMRMVMSPDEKMRRTLNDQQRRVTQDLNAVLTNWDPNGRTKQEREAVAALQASWERYVAIKDVTVNKVLNDYREEAFINSIQAEKEQFQIVKDRLNDWMQQKQQNADSVYAEAEQRFEASSRWYFYLIICLTLFVGALGYLTATTIIGPIEKMRRIATRIAENATRGLFDQLDERIELRSQDELRALATAFNQMIENMQATLLRLAEEERRTQAILNSTADGILTVDARGHLRSMNVAAERLLGCQADTAIDTPVDSFIPALHTNGTSGDAVRRQHGRADHNESEVQARTAQGDEYPIALRIRELDYAGERLTIATLQDITVRKQDEAQRQNLFHAIRDAVQRLTVASRQILESTSEQSVGTQEQASTVAQTVSTVNEIAHTAQQAAQRAKEVAESARHCDDIGNAGSAAIEESVQAMEQVQTQVESLAQNILSLAERAQAIGEITATVNDIAEQTNVLALNAAVEASRAGEHGKGFAVVASEVKSLAQQSKNATHQVRKILTEIQRATQEAVLSTEDGTKAVGTASRVVGEAGETINQLVATLSTSAKLAMQISASANQQAVGVSQLNEGMNSIHNITQRQAETIKQIEQSAQNLNVLSNELANLTA